MAIRHAAAALLVMLAAIPSACGAPDPTHDDASSDATNGTDSMTPRDGSSLGSPLEALYSGPIAGARIANWNPAVPRPVVAVAVRRATQIQTVSMAQIAMDGTIGPLVADDLYLWGWAAGSPGAPTVLYDGMVTGGALPGWNASMRRPLVVMARQTGTQTWVASMLEIHADGTFGSLVADRVIVYGWNAGAPGAPQSRFDGPYDTTTHLTPWDATVIQPMIVMAGQSSTSSRFVSMLEIHADGSLAQIIADSLAVWSF